LAFAFPVVPSLVPVPLSSLPAPSVPRKKRKSAGAAAPRLIDEMPTSAPRYEEQHLADRTANDTDYKEPSLDETLAFNFTYPYAPRAMKAAGAAALRVRRPGDS